MFPPLCLVSRFHLIRNLPRSGMSGQNSSKVTQSEARSNLTIIERTLEISSLYNLTDYSQSHVSNIGMNTMCPLFSACMESSSFWANISFISSSVWPVLERRMQLKVMKSSEAEKRNFSSQDISLDRTFEVD